MGKSGQGAWSISYFFSYSSPTKSSNSTKNLYNSALKVVVILASLRKITELVRWSWISRRSNSLWVIEDQKEEDMSEDHAAGQNHPVMSVLLQLCFWSDHLRCCSPTRIPDHRNEIGKSSGQVYTSKKENMQNVVQGWWQVLFFFFSVMVGCKLIICLIDRLIALPIDHALGWLIYCAVWSVVWLIDWFSSEVD